MNCSLLVTRSPFEGSGKKMIIISAVYVYSTDQSLIDEAHLQQLIPLCHAKIKGINEKLILMTEDTHERVSDNGCNYRQKTKKLHFVAFCKSNLYLLDQGYSAV